jgi:hypothetical protein
MGLALRAGAALARTGRRGSAISRVIWGKNFGFFWWEGGAGGALRMRTGSVEQRVGLMWWRRPGFAEFFSDQLEVGDLEGDGVVWPEGCDQADVYAVDGGADGEAGGIGGSGLSGENARAPVATVFNEHCFYHQTLQVAVYQFLMEDLRRLSKRVRLEDVDVERRGLTFHFNYDQARLARGGLALVHK